MHLISSTWRNNMSDENLVKGLIEYAGSKEKAIEQVEKTIDYMNLKLYKFSEEWLEKEAYMDVYAMYAEIQRTYYKILDTLRD